LGSATSKRLKNTGLESEIKSDFVDFGICRSGVTNLFGARAKLFGKTLPRAFFTLAAKISKS
jgi:hypothetical protein